jgi:penicillin V acylase-like amidase (Ntn superfamily)
MDDVAQPEPRVAGVKSRRWRKFFLRALVAFGIVLLCVAFLVKDYYRTLASLRRIPGTKAYVMDYYVDYHIGEVREHGIDVKHVEDSVIGVLLPKWTHSIAMGLKSRFIPRKVETIDPGHHCSTLMLRSEQGDVFFGRNFDYKHDAYLILKVHGRSAASSVAVLDLHFLNLDRDDLEQSSLIKRLPLLFAPYYLQDGMNQYGVAVADMTVKGARTPYDPAKPSVIHSLAMRLILDYSRNTDEAIELLKQYNIFFVAETVHLLIADASGKSAVVEFIDGELKPTRADETWQVCTNHQISGKSEAENDDRCERYHTASDELAAMKGHASTDDVMKVMQSVQQKTTMWSSVYDLSSGDFRVAYRQSYGNVYSDRLSDIYKAPQIQPSH